MEQVMLRSAPRLYWTAAWAKEEVANKPNLRPLLQEFKRLRHLLRDAPVAVACRRGNCRRRACRMTFILDWVDKFARPDASFWCHKHGPTQYPEEEEEESPTMSLHVHRAEFQCFLRRGIGTARETDSAELSSHHRGSQMVCETARNTFSRTCSVRIRRGTRRRYFFRGQRIPGQAHC